MSHVHQNLAFYRCLLCVYGLSPTVVAKPYLPSVQLSVMALLACYGQGLVPVLVGQSEATLGLSWSD